MNSQIFSELMAVRLWAMQPLALRGLVASAIHAGSFTDVLAQPPVETVSVSGRTALIRVRGGLSHHANAWASYFGFISYEDIAKAVGTAVNDDSVDQIYMEFDTPGGTVSGLPETAAMLREARETKPIIAHANAMAASAGYYLAAQASKVLVAPSGEVGSIGVWTMHQDISKMLEDAGIKVELIFAGDHKVDGNPFEPLTDDARSDMQADVDAFMAMFVEDVAAGRDVSTKTVRENFGQGRMLLAKDALRVGMVDAVSPFAITVEAAAKNGLRKRRSEFLKMIS